ncbi:arylsulfatase regulator [Desulfocucumis palustris]|uniref:Arylsulfatase regulator n=1 Tax=Desulfocucumis palustris TaxID=1898651 RepID=A0A2L2XHL7_9FIRM|nr:radical SAM peptide maturase, CXXX-repeat target family [Desulfocucumis palustris]GBF35484.1 arylsulfatase regulator [Desulfocucumis palustris]
MITPKNGLYLTEADFEQWQDYFSKLIMTEEERDNILEGCSLNPDLKVKNITFVVTEKCNLACKYCYEVHKSNNVMTKETAKRAVDFLFDKKKVNGYYSEIVSPGVILEFIGGEPLLEIDLIDYIVEYFKFRAFEFNHPWALNYMISLTTNGILYDTEKVQRFLWRNPGKVSVGLTIDGNRELHDACRVFPDGSGSYDIVERAARKWIQNEARPQTKITLSPDNVRYLRPALENVWSLGIVGAFTNCCFEEGWTLEHARILYREMVGLADYLIDNELYGKVYTSLFNEAIGKPLTETRNWCGGNGQMLAIGTDGKCFPCIRFMEYSMSTPGRKEQSIGDIWRGLDRREENPWLRRLKEIDMISQSAQKCIDCQIAAGCSLCTGYNYDRFGDPNVRATFICDMQHARVAANVYYWNRLYRDLGLDQSFDDNVPGEFINLLQGR